ncbi:MAG TPA: ComF family protein [Candidatus Parcubacteria bacterium]|nr:ComF family protein [Candidatus Parcubacteria bacterium]
MKPLFLKIKNFLLDLFFPSFCLNCQREGSFFCQDCLSLIETSRAQYCPFCKKPKIVSGEIKCLFCQKNKSLDSLFAAASYQNPLLKRAIFLLKYKPFVKELAKPLSFLIIKHFQLLDYPPSFLRNKNGFVLIAVPLSKKKLKKRGFNQSEEIAKELSRFLEIPLYNKVLLKTRETLSQTGLNKEERIKNVEGAFLVQNKEKIENKKVLLVDDVFTTGATMEECAKVLKKAGAERVIGVALARE